MAQGYILLVFMHVCKCFMQMRVLCIIYMYIKMYTALLFAQKYPFYAAKYTICIDL